jgi:hypothetical protein
LITVILQGIIYGCRADGESNVVESLLNGLENSW